MSEVKAHKPSKGAAVAAPLTELLPPTVRPRQAAQILGIGLSTLWLWHKTRKDFSDRVRLRRIGPRTTVLDTAELIAFRDSVLP